MEFHLKVVSEHLTGAFEYLETTESERLYGEPHDRGGGSDPPTRVMQSAMGSATLAR
jgi:hypothetical protein